MRGLRSLYPAHSSADVRWAAGGRSGQLNTFLPASALHTTLFISINPNSGAGRILQTCRPLTEPAPHTIPAVILARPPPTLFAQTTLVRKLLKRVHSKLCEREWRGVVLPPDKNSDLIILRFIHNIYKLNTLFADK